MAKSKMTGFKIFLFSLLGTVVGAFALGAFTNATRDDEKTKAPTEITLETFQDSNNYMEVILEEGDKVGGCWLRMYADNQIKLDGDFADDEAGFSFLNITKEKIGMSQNSQWVVDLTLAVYLSDDDGGEASYVDFYLPVGEVTFTSMEGDRDVSYTVTSETAISSMFGVHCYKLQVI